MMTLVIVCLLVVLGVDHLERLTMVGVSATTLRHMKICAVANMHSEVL